MWLIAACLAFMVLCTPVAQGACSNWGHYTTSPTDSILFVGKIGDRTIAMLLHLDSKTGRFDGAYGYANRPGTSTLTGNMLPHGAGAILDAHDKRGMVIGHLSLLFFHPIYKSTNWNNYKKWYINSCDTTTGIWRASKNDNAQYVELVMTGERNPSQTNTMKLNDAVAYKLNRAMQTSNKIVFASLLRYPFCTASAQGIYKVFTTPADTVRSYETIISTLSPDTPVFYMPHFVTDDSFMNGSVHFEDGKIALICLGHCPNPFDNPCPGDKRDGQN